MDFILPFIIALAVVVIIRLLAGTDNIIGHICRAFWNISFKIVAFIPFMGWMSHFIIADTDAEIRAKESYVERNIKPSKLLNLILLGGIILMIFSLYLISKI